MSTVARRLDTSELEDRVKRMYKWLDPAVGLLIAAVAVSI